MKRTTLAIILAMTTAMPATAQTRIQCNVPVLNAKDEMLYCTPKWVSELDAVRDCTCRATPRGQVGGGAWNASYPDTPDDPVGPVDPEDPPVDPPKDPKPPKDNNGHGNGDEGDCKGKGCTDPTNPGKKPKK